MVPNLFTVGNMALGFFALMAAVHENWVVASTAIFIAHVLDVLDGRIARWMGMTSRFGAEFDSFADWISFGLAPAVMVYFVALKDFGKLGFLLAFFYIFAGALRLARFNVKSLKEEEGQKVHFTGLPIPGAGGLLAVLVLLYGLFENGNQGKTMNFLYHQAPFLKEGIPIIVFLLSLLMMSKIEYSNFKKTRFFYPKSLRAFMIMLFVCFMIYAYPQNTIFFLYVGYILWGILNTGWRAYRLRKTAES